MPLSTTVRNMRTLGATVLVLGAIGFASGCSSTTQGSKGDIKFSGFLKNYDQLKPATDEGMLYGYVEPKLNLSSYNKIIVDNPKVMITPEKRKKVGDEPLTALTNYFDQALRTKLGEKWELVKEPGPGVLRLRTAISELSGATTELSLFTNVIPQTATLNKIFSWTTSEHPFAASVAGEAELVDSNTGKRLFAVVDMRVGTNMVTNSFSTWGEVKDAFDYWAARAATRLLKWGMSPTK